MLSENNQQTNINNSIFFVSAKVNGKDEQTLIYLLIFYYCCAELVLLFLCLSTHSLRICLIEHLTNEQVPPARDECVFEFSREFRSSWINAKQTVCYTFYDLRALNARNCDKLPAQKKKEINHEIHVHSFELTGSATIAQATQPKTLFKYFWWNKNIRFVHITHQQQHENQLNELHRS